MIVLNQFSGNQVKGSRSKAGLAPQALVPFKTPLKEGFGEPWFPDVDTFLW